MVMGGTQVASRKAIRSAAPDWKADRPAVAACAASIAVLSCPPRAAAVRQDEAPRGFVSELPRRVIRDEVQRVPPICDYLKAEIAKDTAHRSLDQKLLHARANTGVEGNALCRPPLARVHHRAAQLSQTGYQLVEPAEAQCSLSFRRLAAQSRRYRLMRFW